MLTLPIPTFRSAAFPGVGKPAVVRRRKTPAGEIWSLHRVIADPEATASEVLTAKRLLLRVLANSHELPRLSAPAMNARIDSGADTRVWPDSLRIQRPSGRRSRTAMRSGQASSVETRAPSTRQLIERRSDIPHPLQSRRAEAEPATALAR